MFQCLYTIRLLVCDNLVSLQFKHLGKKIVLPTLQGFSTWVFKVWQNTPNSKIDKKKAHFHPWSLGPMTAPSLVVWYMMEEDCRRANFIVNNVIPGQVVLEIKKQSEQTTGSKPVGSTTPWPVFPFCLHMPALFILYGWKQRGVSEREGWGVGKRVFQLCYTS